VTVDRAQTLFVIFSRDPLTLPTSGDLADIPHARIDVSLEP